MSDNRSQLRAVFEEVDRSAADKESATIIAEAQEHFRRRNTELDAQEAAREATERSVLAEAASRVAVRNAGMKALFLLRTSTDGISASELSAECGISEAEAADILDNHASDHLLRITQGTDGKYRMN